MKPRAPLRPPTAIGSTLPSGSDVFRSSQADGVNPAASVTRTRANRLPPRTISSASGTPMNISDATSGAVVTIPSLHAPRRHPAGRSTLYPSSVFVYRVRPAATVAVGAGGAGETAAVGIGLGVAPTVGMDVGADDTGEQAASNIAVTKSAFISAVDRDRGNPSIEEGDNMRLVGLRIGVEGPGMLADGRDPELGPRIRARARQAIAAGDRHLRGRRRSERRRRDVRDPPACRRRRATPARR